MLPISFSPDSTWEPRIVVVASAIIFLSFHSIIYQSLILLCTILKLLIIPLCFSIQDNVPFHNTMAVQFSIPGSEQYQYSAVVYTTNVSNSDSFLTIKIPTYKETNAFSGPGLASALPSPIRLSRTVPRSFWLTRFGHFYQQSLSWTVWGSSQPACHQEAHPWSSHSQTVLWLLGWVAVARVLYCKMTNFSLIL